MGMEILYFFIDLLVGYLPQASSYALCLTIFLHKPLVNRNFFLMSLCYIAFSIPVRFLYTAGLVNFGFHTLIILLFFVVVAVLAFNAPAGKAVLSVLVSSGILVFFELISVSIFNKILGEEQFDLIMNSPDDIRMKITKSLCGAPNSVLLFLTLLALYFVMRSHDRKKAAAEKAAEDGAEA